MYLQDKTEMDTNLESKHHSILNLILSNLVRFILKTKTEIFYIFH
jgi:hypothetical protein